MYATLLVPLVLVPGFFFPFVSTRGIYFRLIIEIALAIFVTLLATREYRKSTTRDPLLISLAAFVGANALAAAFGLAPWRSFFGDFERMWGVWTYLHLFMYYILLRTFLNPRGWTIFLRASVVICSIACVYGIIQFYQDVLGVRWEGAAGSQIHSTIGNSGLFAAYLLFNLGFSVYLWFEDKMGRWHFAYLPITALITFTLFLAANRSTLLGVMLGLFVATVCYAVLKARRKWLPPLIAAAAALLILTPALIVRANPDSSLNKHLPTVLKRVAGTSTQTTDAIRLYQWRAAVQGFADRPILGYGPENYHLVWSANFNPEAYKVAGDDRWDRAHDAYLEVMSTSGIVGMTTFIALLAAFIYLLFHAYRKGTITAGGLSTLLGLFVAYGFYLIFWFLDLNSTMLFIAIGAHVAARNDTMQWVEFDEKKPMLPARRILLGSGALLLVALLYLHTYAPLRASHNLHRVVNPKWDNNPEIRQKDFEQLFKSPAPQEAPYLQLYSQFLSKLRPMDESKQMDRYFSDFMDKAFILGFKEADRELRRDPWNERLYLYKGRLQFLAASFYNNPRLYKNALISMNRAVELNPMRINSRLVLATTYMAVKDYKNAGLQLAKAHSIYPKSPQTHYAFAQLESARGNPAEAAHWMMSAMRLGYAGSAEVVLSIGKAVGESDKTMERALYVKHLDMRYPGFRETGVLQTSQPLPPQIEEMVQRLGKGLQKL